MHLFTRTIRVKFGERGSCQDYLVSEAAIFEEHFPTMAEKELTRVDKSWVK